MARKVFFRMTPRRILTLNNRWWDNVHPKKTLFFLPVDKDQLELWKNFLCETHHRSFVFLHEVYVDCPKYRYRKLTTYKGQPLYEVLVKQWDLEHVVDRKVLKVFKTLPIKLRYFPSGNKAIDAKNGNPFMPKKARQQERNEARRQNRLKLRLEKP